MRRNEPVLRKLALLVSGPIVPASPATPVKALSNLLVSSIWLTPSFFISASSASICSSVQVGRPSWTLQPSGTEVSMPMTTASLPCVDDLAGLERVGDDAVPPAAGAAVLRVDVVLHRPHVLGLQAHGVAVVARVLLERVDRAEDVVLGEQAGVDAQPGAPRALEPLVVDLLVRQRVRVGPVGERRPAHRVVAAAGGLAGQDVLERGAATVGELVVGAVDERGGGAVPVERRAADHPAAEELVGLAVDVRVDVAADLLEAA